MRVQAITSVRRVTSGLSKKTRLTNPDIPHRNLTFAPKGVGMPEARFAYDIYSPSENREQNLPPIILLHGLLDTRKTWKNVGPLIAQNTGRKVYSLDARNHGESFWSDDLTFNLLADDLQSFLSQQGISKASLVGHSMGGKTAATVALRKPECVEKLVVEDMNLRPARPSPNSFLLTVTSLMRESLKKIPPDAELHSAREAVFTFFKSIFGEMENPLGMTTNYDLEMMALKKDKNGYSWQLNFKVIEEFLTTDKILHTLSGAYMGDALFLYGTKSIFKVESDESIPKYFPNAVKLGIENAGHLVHLEYPDRFVQEVSNFINGHVQFQSKY